MMITSQYSEGEDYMDNHSDIAEAETSSEPVEATLPAELTSDSPPVVPNLPLGWTSESGLYDHNERTSTAYYDECYKVNETTNETYYDAANCNYEYYYEEGYLLQIYPFEIIVLGYVLPALILFTAVTNIFVVAFFLTKKNRGKATDLLFVSIALSDTLTGLMLIPNSIEIFAKDRMVVSKEWCNAYMILRFYVSPVFHTVSVWQTVTLGIQRYLCVCHPFISGQICTFWKTFVSIVVMYCGAIVLHTYHLTDNKIGISRCRWQTEDPCVLSCMYLWFCLILEHLLPCLLLLCLTIVTLKELSKAQKRVSSMSHNGRLRRSSSRSVRDRTITITATLIVICFLIPELPHGIYKLVFVINKHTNKHLLPEENHIIICIYEIALVISFNANFWIYCAMMHDFRHKLLRVLTFGAVKQGVSRLRSLSVSSKCGSMVTTLSRTSSNASHNKVVGRTVSVHSTTSENIHSVIPLTPTKGYDKIKFTERYKEHAELKQTDSEANDDVFV